MPVSSPDRRTSTAVSRCAGEQKQGAEPAVAGAGVLKANWFAKHRQRRPAVAAVFLDRQAAAGDPSAWSRACAALEAVRAAVKPRGARIVVAVVQVTRPQLLAVSACPASNPTDPDMAHGVPVAETVFHCCTRTLLPRTRGLTAVLSGCRGPPCRTSRRLWGRTSQMSGWPCWHARPASIASEWRQPQLP